MSRKLLTGILWLMVLLASCKIDSLEDPIIVPLVDQEFNLDLWEKLGPDGSKLEIQFRTLLNEPCLNTSILSSYQKAADKLELTIYEILPPEQCQLGLAPAYGSEIMIGIEHGVNELKVELQGVVVNSGTITVTDSVYRVNMISEDGIGWERNELRRVPAGALWGYLTFEDQQDADYVDDFKEQLNQLADPFTSLVEGYYGHFEVFDFDNTLLFKIKDIPEAVFKRPFLLQFNGQTSEISDLVDNFRAGAPEGVEVKVLDYKGNEW